MNLTEAYLLLAVMLAVVAVVSVLFKGKSGLIAPLIFVAGLITALVAGLGFRLREVTEGPFVFVDTLMWVLCGAAFSYLLYVNGTFQFLFAKVVGKKRSPAAQMFILILFIGLPGMITGTALASVATTGLMAGRYLLDKGMEKSKVVEVVTVGALMGMLLPPLCVPAMAPTTARQGLYPGAFEGYFLPILILALPALFVSFYLIRPMKQISDKMREAEHGDLDVRIHTRRRDELGYIGHRLNVLLKNIDSLIHTNYETRLLKEGYELKFIQTQLKEHFIYNTLESISMLALIRDNYEIVDMAQAFSMMMRYSMEPSTLVAVREEVETVRNFVTIQKIRFPDRFLVEYAIDEECMAEKIPRLTMQPLVENAFKHGFEDTPEHKRLLVSVLKRRGFLVIRIFNDGMAVPAERIARIRELLMPDNQEETMDCFALRNLSRRLKLLFGGNSQVTLRSGNGIGTIVSLRIPLRKEGEEDDDKDFDL